MDIFKTGDVVRVKSGGPKMTVYSPDGVGIETGIYCKWFVSEKGNQVLKEGLFQPEMLEKVEEEGPRRVHRAS